MCAHPGHISKRRKGNRRKKGGGPGFAPAGRREGKGAGSDRACQRKRKGDALMKAFGRGVGIIFGGRRTAPGKKRKTFAATGENAEGESWNFDYLENGPHQRKKNSTGEAKKKEGLEKRSGLLAWREGSRTLEAFERGGEGPC